MAPERADGGHRFALTPRGHAELASLASELEPRGSTALVMPADALDRVACRAVLTAAAAAIGRIDVAVLTEGGGRAVSTAEATTEEVLEIVRRDLDTAVHFRVPLIADMKGQGGAWSPSRALLIALTRRLAEPVRRWALRRAAG